MAKINLGLNKEAIASAKDTYDGPMQRFPCNKAGYTKYSAVLTALEIKQSKDGEKSWLWLQVTNGVCQDSILVNLDPSDVAPTTLPDKVEGAVKRNLDTLLRVVKVLDLSSADGTGIDTDKFASAIGTLISFGAKLGDMQQNGYYKTYTSFYGKAESLVPVEFGPMDTTTGGSVKDDSDIPF